ncbi:alpha/beta fold hydrolase [Segnochrobactrum spirostomi]|uniref:Alpha/beta hydrolase n=1 Tax=Segnochrobactrum spirostomi TaxID=2608987 RepID=A0A6A7Y731_9HYPH|nr:alpha/beta hydrolase [Segnochrobactrum spirostomi]MQT13891.1 alpha/beta hydrolase [Segnochrobactrum spirostomi]
MSRLVPIGPGGRRGALDRLVELPQNPVPEGAQVAVVEGCGGVPLRAAFWPATVVSPRGTVLVVQGRAEAIEKYFETVGDLRARGFAVAGFDLRGQGGSGRLYPDPLIADVGRFEDYVEDVGLVLSAVRRAGLPEPFTLLGHSTGGTVALGAAARDTTGLARVIATAPMFGLTAVDLTSAPVGALLALLMAAGLGRRPVNTNIDHRTFETNALTHDAARFERTRAIFMAEPALRIGPPTYHWLKAMRDGIRRLAGADGLAQCRIPALVVAAGEERIVSTPRALAAAGRIPKGNALVIEGARHEVLQETDALRARFWAAFDAFTA